jgi:hypothetical protein
MKILLIALVALSSLSAFAEVTEGRLIAKLQGELDPVVLGDGCISIVEYYDDSAEYFKKIGIYQDDSVTCISEDVEENEEIDFDREKLKLIKNKAQLRELKSLTNEVMKVKGVKSFYKL